MKIQTGKKAKPRKLLIYGVPGVGKSTFAAGSSRPIFWATEQGLDDIGPDRLTIDTVQDMTDARNYTVEHADEYDTLVIDGCTGFNDLMLSIVCEPGQAIEDAGEFGKGQGRLLEQWKLYYHRIVNVAESCNMHLVLVAHSEVITFRNPQGDDFDQFAPLLPKRVRAYIRAELDEILFAQYKVRTVTNAGEFGRKVTKTVEGGKPERIFIAQDRAACQAKNRLGIETELPLDWKEYAAHWPTKTQATTTTKKASK